LLVLSNVQLLGSAFLTTRTSRLVPQLPFPNPHAAHRKAMASLEDYDEFGNYIGADLDSDDEDEPSRNDYAKPTQAQSAPLEGYEDEPVPAHGDGELMVIDGTARLVSRKRSLNTWLSHVHRAYT
jgi:hypothetical protein